MPTTKRASAKSKSSTKTRSRAKASAKKPAKSTTRSAARPAVPASPAAPISSVTGLPVRQKVHLPIKGYGRYNSFQVLEQLYGKSVSQLKEILTYEEAHQKRRMIIDRINDMIRRATMR